MTVAKGVTRTGYTFSGWKLDHNDKTYKAGASFTMPAGDVTLTAQWTQSPVVSSGPESEPPASSKPDSTPSEPGSEPASSRPASSEHPSSKPAVSSERPASSGTTSSISSASTESSSPSRAYSTAPASSTAPPPPAGASSAGSEATSTVVISAPTTSAASSSSSSSSTVSSSSGSSSVSSGGPEAGAFVVSEPLPPDDTNPGGPAGDTAGDAPAAGDAFSPDDLARIERQTGNVLRDLLNGEVPLGNLRQSGAWSLASLILSVLSLLTSVAIGVTTLLRKRRQEAEDEQAYDASADETPAEAEVDEQGDENPRRRKLAVAAALILGIFPGLLFVILDDMSLPLVLLNKWTLWVGVAFVLHMVVTLVQAFAKRKAKDGEEDGIALEPQE